MNIRQASGDDFEAIWPIFKHIVAAGNTYAYARHTSKDQARTIWLVSPKKTYVAEIEGVIVGTYFIKTNQNETANIIRIYTILHTKFRPEIKIKRYHFINY